MASKKKNKERKIKKRKKKSFWQRRTRFQKFVIGAVLGYICGVIFTYFWFIFLATQIGVNLHKSTSISCIMAVVFTIGLAYNTHIRCIVILILPNFFSVKGRSFLVAYAFILAATGPCKNILYNVDVLCKSLSCGQEMLKKALGGMLDVVKKPLVAIKNAVKMAIKAMKKVLVKVEKVLKRIRDVIMKVLKVIKKAFVWLGNILNVCNKKVGTPFERCMNLAEDAITDCKNKLGVMSFLCNVAYVMKGICYSVKFIDVVCVLVDFISDAVVGNVTRGIKRFTEEIKNMFYVSVKFKHDFKFKSIASKNLKQVGNDILADIHRRSSGFFLFFGWMEILGSLMFLRIFLKAYYYRSKYLRIDRFDNFYITKDFVEVDEKRKKMGKDTALPLTRKEGRRYVQITSSSLVKAEKLKLARSAMFLIITTVQLMSMCVVDYCLFWVLWTIRFHGRKEAGLEMPSMMTVSVVGQGFVSEIYSGIIDSFRPAAEKYDLDPIPCLPNPKPPNFSRYFQIGFTMFLVWTFLFLEPYGLRLRQIIMRNFYPERARQRAVWLHNHIILRRTSFLKLARRNARARFLKDGTKGSYSFIDWLRAKTDRCWLMRKILGKGSSEFCMLCATPLKSDGEMILCPRPGCTGKYCKPCFSELNNICFLCREPIEYGDLSDVSEEKDSSDEFEGVRVDKYCLKK